MDPVNFELKEGAKPVCSFPYTVPMAHKISIKKEIEKLDKKRVFEWSNCWEKLKMDDGQTHVHAIFCSHTYMRPSSVGLMAASEVELPSVEMTATSAVTSY